MTQVIDTLHIKNAYLRDRAISSPEANNKNKLESWFVQKQAQKYVYHPTRCYDALL